MKLFYYLFVSFVTCANVIFMTHSRYISLTLLSCARSKNKAYEIQHKPIGSILDCARLYLELEYPVVMVIQQGDDGAVWCGMASEIPVLSSCSDKDSDVFVYISSDRWQTPQVTCHGHLTLDGVTYCIHTKAPKVAYNESAEYCRQIGGRVAQAKTREDLVIIWNTLSTVCGWLDADDVNNEIKYRWTRGDLVDTNLFLKGEPSHSHEHCIAVHYKFGSFGLGDRNCPDRVCGTVCAIVQLVVSP